MKTYAIYTTNVCDNDCCYEENKDHVDEPSREILIELTPKNLDYLKSSNWHINHDDNEDLGIDIKDYEDVSHHYDIEDYRTEQE